MRLRTTIGMWMGVMFITPIAGAETLQVAALTPMMADLARQVGGDAVDVMDIMGLDESPHTFDPGPGELARLRSARIVVASGKGLEDGFMDKINNHLAPGALLVQAGRKVPSLKIEADGQVFMCCPHHGGGAIDPHWWHSVKGMRRAASRMAVAFADADPANRALYKQNEAAYRKQLSELDNWVQQELAAIPRSRRYLTTAHAAFGYFCRDYGFEAAPVQDLNKEHAPSPDHLAKTLEFLRKKKIPALFPEVQSNPKELQSLAAKSGARVGSALLADTLTSEHPTYVDCVRYNVSAIVEALK